jgi:hypothetical protein
VSIPVKVLVTLELDGVVYVSGEIAEFPESHAARAREFASYGYVTPASEEPVKKTRRKTASTS